MKRGLLFFGLLVSFGWNSLYSQTFEGNAANQMINGAKKVTIHPRNNSIQFMVLNENFAVPENNISAWLQGILLKNNPEASFIQSKKQKDHLGFIHYEFIQKINNTRVEYAVYKVHCQGGKIVSANGEYYPYNKAIDKVKFNSRTAIQKAIQHYKQDGIPQKDITTNFIETVYFPTKEKQLNLCYKIDIYAIGDNTRRSYLYIDAQTNSILFEENRIHTIDVSGTTTTKYCGLQTITADSISPSLFHLKETGLRNIHTLNLNTSTNPASATEFTDNDNFWDSTSNNDAVAHDAHYGTEKTWDYFLNTFSRNSYDDLGAEMISHVHYGAGIINAFWDGTQMKYGDGDGINFKPLTSTEIVAHEITHAITQYSAALVYANESGALNESFSDIFGVTVDYYANPSTANFLMGDQFSVSGIPFRTMSDPHASLDPDTYLGAYWDPAQGVHQNSNVQNYWYYLLCTGGSGVNDNSENYFVNSITMNHAAAIAYRTLTTYLTPNSNYSDARAYSIQSAIDLYGPCSNEVIQVTNAWHAVGVGGIFSNAVTAQFHTIDTLICGLPASATFINNSANATSYYWDFGDGDTSSLQNPTHIYNSLGVFTVKLISNGTAICGNSDTLTLPNYITITNNPIPITAVCTPFTTSTCCNYGISNVSLNTINKNSANAMEGYRNFTCGNYTELIAGSTYQLHVTTHSLIPQYVKVFIDYDNDGNFSTLESVFTSSFIAGLHSGFINTPLNALISTPLRMRVISSSNTISVPCGSILNGQAEDYTIVFIPNTLPPIAEFITTTNPITAGTPINFQDISIYAPTSWSWTFTGATSTSSSLQNPTLVFNIPGTYSVQFIATNSFGSDTITKTILVENVFTLCQPNSIQTSSATIGHLFDSGGASGDYQDLQDCSFLINPVCADSIVLAFSSFATEAGYDSIYIYDGINNTGSLLYSGSGNVLPPITNALSGNMFIHFHTDASNVASGFEAAWEIFTTTTAPPLADFDFSPSNPALLDTVFFTDISSNNATSWYWNFGDGNSSNFQNPNHTYNNSGTHTITLIATSCNSYDTITKNITVQSAPFATYTPTAINVSIDCNDTLNIPLLIENMGAGALNWDATTSNNSTVNAMLIWTYGVETTTNSEYFNTLDAINQYYTNYSFDTTSTEDPIILENMLVGKKVLLIPEKENGNATTVALFANAIQNFVQTGGTVVVCGDGYTLENLGIFNSIYHGSTFGNLQLTNNTTPLSNNVAATLTGCSTTNYRTISNSNKMSILNYNSIYDVVTYIPYGSGKAIYIGFDYFSYGNDQARIIANAVEWGMNHADANINLDINNGSSLPGEIDTAHVTITSAGLSSGLHTYYIIVHTNNPLNLTDSIPVYVTISPMPCVNFGHTTVAGCTGVIGFIDSTGNNPTSWLWNFGDGNISTLQQPIHNYLASGTYTVTLIASNASGSDSSSKIITINSVGGPITSICEPQTLTPNILYGISNVTFQNINNNSGSSVSGYEDFTCSVQTNLYTATQYLLQVTTFNINEHVNAWIDFNSDGIFSFSENIAIMNPNGDTLHTALVSIPASSIMLSTPLRLRIISDNDTILSACHNSLFGQCEDYSVKIKINYTPIASFFANPTIVWVGEPVQYTDSSINIPLNWNWNLPGATPNISTLQNPMVVYNTPGLYDASLIASNNDGSDTATINSYIQVNALPNSGFNFQVNTCNGLVHFTASLPAPYNDNSWDFGDGTIVSSFSPTISHTYSSADTFTVILIAKSPYGNDTITQNIIISFWEPTIAHTGILVSNSPITFYINSILPISNYTWNFGDGSPLSNLASPVHTYSSNGGYVVVADVVFDTACHKILFDTLNISIPQGINYMTKNDILVNVSPNPFENEVNINVSGIEKASMIDFKIMTALGQIVYAKHESNLYLKNRNYKIEHALVSGHYLLEVIIDGMRFVKKIERK